MPTKKEKIKISMGAQLSYEEDGRIFPIMTCAGTNEFDDRDFEEVIKNIRNCIQEGVANRKRYLAKKKKAAAPSRECRK